MITLYSKPGCQPCRATKRKLDQEGIEYQVVDVTEDPGAVTTVTELGYNGVPVVALPNGESWHGYRPDLIDQLAS